MSDSDKHRFFLMEQLEAIGTRCEESSVQEDFVKHKNIFKTENGFKEGYEKYSKEAQDNTSQESLEKTEFSKIENKSDESSMKCTENQKDEINKMKKSRKEGNCCPTNENDHSKIGFIENNAERGNQCQVSLKRGSSCPCFEFQNCKMSLKESICEKSYSCFLKQESHTLLRKEDKAIMNEALKDSQRTSNPQGFSKDYINVTKKYAACILDKIVQREIMTLTKSNRISMDNKNIKETAATNDNSQEDSEKLKQNECEETSMKEYYFDETFEKENSVSTKAIKHDCYIENMSSGQIGNNVSIQGDRDGYSREEKEENDMREVEKILQCNILDSTDAMDGTHMETNLTSLFSPDLLDEKPCESDDYDEQIKMGSYEEISMGKRTTFSTDFCEFEEMSLLDGLPTFVSQSFHYRDEHLKDLSEEMCFNFEIDCSFSFPSDSCKHENDDELKMLYSQEIDKQKKAMWPLNELSTTESTEGWFCFQNNIVLDTLNMECESVSFVKTVASLRDLDINILESLRLMKCTSKNVFSSVIHPLISPLSSSSCNFSHETIHAWEIIDSDKIVKSKEKACLPSLRNMKEEMEKVDVPKKCFKASSSIISIKKMKNISTFHDEDKNKSKNAKERQPLKTGYSSKEFNGLKTNYTMIKGKRGGTRKNMLKQDIKKNANCPSGEHGFHYHKADNNPKAPHTKNGRVYLFRKQLRKSGVHVKKKFQRKHSSINLMGKQTDLPSSSKSLHANLQVGKFRQHTGDKGSQRGDSGARATANGGSEGGGTGRQGGGSRSARRLQGSGGGNQGFGSGGDDPDDHNNRKTREYGNGHKCNTTDDENGDDDKSEKKAYSKGNGNCLKRNSHQHNEAHAKHAPASALPNLPKPNWDASTLRQRQAKELMFQDDPPGSSQTSPLKLFLPPVSSQNERVDLMVPCSTPVPNTVAGNGLNSADQSSRKHGVISITQLCEIIGSATIDANVPSGLFEQFNICLTKWMHDLSFGLRELNDATEVGNIVSDSTLAINSSTSTCGVTATSADGSLLQPPGIEKTPPKLCNASESPSSSLSCTVCLMVSGLVTHLSHCRQPQCMQCAQILNLMTQHARSCVGKNRPQHRITSSDLCYKICKKAGWNSENISCDSASFKGKIQKYCDKALGKSSKNLASSKEFETTSSIGIGEMESVRDNDGLSSGANSIALLSLSGNPVALESGGSFPEKSSLTPIGQLGRDPDSFVSVASEAAASSVPLTLSQHVTTSNGQIGALTYLATSIGSKSLRSLTRKSSYRSPAIPQPIEEVSTAAEEELVAAEGQSGQNDTDIREFIYRRFPLKGTDPYDTQPTFGDKKGYESMPQGILHDQEQFFSFGNRAVGVPGIGEVVFGNHKQLRLVAGFWEKKREDCERTGTTPPYQHREEGVILSQYKGHFSILRTRYQKHHQWERVAHLGNGMSGKCHLVTDLKTEFKFCCKKVHLLKYTKEEVNIWSELDHPFIVKLYGAIRNGVKIYIFCEFIDGGSLATCIEEQRHLGQRFSHWAAINYFHQLLKILAYLQSKDVLHEDIKADNILLRNGCTYIALTDFGTCRRLCDPKELLHKSPLGSPAHWSPEKAASQGHGFPSDLWAGVCVLIHMLSGDPPWMRRFMKSATILNFIIYSREPPLEDVPQNVQPMVRDLIASGLVKDPVQRPRADKLLGHEAFNILENRQPERYYSSLGGQSQAALLSKVHDTEKAQKILYRTEIATGPYQESAGPADNSRVKRDIETETTGPTEEENSTGKAFAHITTEEEEILPSINFNLELERPSEVLREDGERSEQNLSDSRRENIPRRLNEATAHFPSQNSSAKKDMGNSEEKHVSSSNKPQPIPDLDALLSSLFVPDENKAFYHDEVPDGAEALKQSTVKQQQLQVYVPESRKENQLPNLSIFTVDLSDGSGQGGSATLTPRSLFEAVAENQSSSSQHAVSSITDGELRLALSSAVVAENFNGTSFILSSESEYTSADLFDQGSYAGPETIVNGSASYEKEPCVTPTNPLHFQGAGNPSHNAFGASLSSQSLSTNLQQRKPNHLKLQLSPTNSGLTVSAHGAGDSSSSNERGSRAASNKSNLRTQSHRTPSTGRLSATSSSGRHGGSSTSGSRTSPLPFRFNTPGSSSVLEEQDKMLQLLKAEHESLSSSGSELYTEDQVPTQADDLSSAMAENWQLALSKLQENIEISSLEGHALQLYDENSMQVVLPVHFMDTPINKRQLIESISGRMSNQYGHFSLLHMDKSPLNLSTPLEVHKLLVRQLPGPQKGCLCDSCRSQF